MLGHIVPVAMFAAAAAYFAVVTAIAHRLKARHGGTWEKLGRFTLFLNNSISGGWKFLRYFIFSNAFRELEDPVLNRLAFAAKALFAIFSVFFLWQVLLTD